MSAIQAESSAGRPGELELRDIHEDDDELAFCDESEEDSEEGAPSEHWSVLMVDDDEQVHQSTMLALGDEVVLGRGLKFEHARSGSEAVGLIASRDGAPDLAFVDMVMETPDAGLRFAMAAKEDPRWSKTRILLRSGQPGFSNEMEIAKKIGVEGFAQKASVSRSILRDALVELLSGRTYFKG